MGGNHPSIIFLRACSSAPPPPHHGASIIGRNKKLGAVLQSSREQVTNWVVRAFTAIADDGIREACLTTYFPGGLKMSQLEHTEFFRKHNPESDYDDGSQTDTDDSCD